MLLSAKTKGFFVDIGVNGYLLARVSHNAGVTLIEEVYHCGLNEAEEQLEQIKQKLQPQKNPSGFLSAVCGVWPEDRVVRRLTVDLKRFREQGYLSDLVSTQLRIEESSHSLMMLNPKDGKEFDAGKGSKDVLICGLPAADISAIQKDVLGRGIYPDALEIGSIGMLGAITDYCQFKELKTPILVLELGSKVTNTYIVGSEGVEASRPIPYGLEAMVPIVQSELGLKDEESARKLFYSNAFDFTGMGPAMVRKLIKELQSSIGFYEVQTGQTIAHLCCTFIPRDLAWLEKIIATQLGVEVFRPDIGGWLNERKVTLSEMASSVFPLELSNMGLLGLILNHSETDGSAE